MENINKNHNKRKKIYIEIVILFIVIIVIFTVSMFVTLNKKTEEILTNKEDLVNTGDMSNKGSLNNDISSGINKITAINYNSNIEKPTTYIVIEPEKIGKILKLFANANWKNCKYAKGTAGIKTIELTDKNHCSWYIKMEGNKDAEFFMYGIPVVKVKINGQEEVYEIDEMEYKEILSEFDTRYYLHKSNVEKPQKNQILELRNKIFKDLTNEEIAEIKDTIRLTHTGMELQLLDSVNIIKDANSPYWNQSNYGGIYKDPLTGVETESTIFFNMKLQKLERVKDIIKNEEIKKEFEDIIELLKNAMDNHDLEGCFKVHEFIHDYDYYAINYPAYFPTYPPPDWEGINVYFGHLKLN